MIDLALWQAQTDGGDGNRHARCESSPGLATT